MFRFHQHILRRDLSPISIRYASLLLLIMGTMMPLDGFANPFHIRRFGGLVDSGATSRSPFSICGTRQD